MVAAIALLGGLTLALWLSRFVLGQQIPFDTDEADHALPALDLVRAVQRLDPAGFAGTITTQAFYPPVHSLFCAASMLLLGPTHAAARLPSVLFFFATALTVACAAHRQVATRGGRAEWLPLGAATITFLLAITSLEAIDNAVLCMLESLGTFWCALLLLLGVGPERGDTRRWVLALTALTIAIALTKYSFGLMTIPAVGCALLLRPPAGERRGAIGRALWFAGCVGAGLAAWLLVTDPYSALRFITGHESSGPVLGRANLLFDAKAWYHRYFVSPVLALAVLPLIAAAIATGWSRFSIRLAALLLAFAELMALLSTTNETRHALFVLPAAWYLSGVGAAVLVERTARRARRRGRGRARPAVAFSVFLLATGLLIGRQLPRLDERLRRDLESVPEIAELQQAILAAVDATAPILGTGFSDRFSAQGLRFALASGAGLPSTALRLDVYPYTDKNFQRSRERKRHVDRPFLDPAFPREPLSAVLEQRYYRHALQVENLRHRTASRARDAEELRRTLEPFLATTQRAGDWRVTIWDLGATRSQ